MIFKIMVNGVRMGDLGASPTQNHSALVWVPSGLSAVLPGKAFTSSSSLG